MATHGAVLTAEEFFAMPEDDQLYELLDGELRAGLVIARAVEGAPTLLIEVSSPSTRHLDRRRKFELHAWYGVPHTLRAAGDEPLSLPPFAGLAFVPASLWRP